MMLLEVKSYGHMQEKVLKDTFFLLILIYIDTNVYKSYTYIFFNLMSTRCARKVPKKRHVLFE